MAEVLRANKNEFARLDDLVNYPLVRLWLYWGLFWLMFTPSIGVTISTLFNYPDYLGTSEYLTFGRLRPMHVNGVIFGAFSTLFIGLCYYLLPRLCGVRVIAEPLGWWLVWVWNSPWRWDCSPCPSATTRAWRRASSRSLSTSSS